MRHGDELRRRRKALGLTQDALAERARLSTHYISAIENGRIKDPSLSTLAALAKALGTNVGELVGGSLKMPELTPLAIEVAHLFDAVPEELQQSVLTILRMAPRRRAR
jgi:transcriptional regulator with XRE-family HTH domain